MGPCSFRSTSRSYTLADNYALRLHFCVSRIYRLSCGPSDNLEELSLCNYYASSSAHYLTFRNIAEIRFYYRSKLFSSLCSTGPAKLHHMELIGSGMPFPSKEQFDEKTGEIIRNTPQEDPTRLCFPYAICANLKGHWFMTRVGVWGRF